MHFKEFDELSRLWILRALHYKDSIYRFVGKDGFDERYIARYLNLHHWLGETSNGFVSSENAPEWNQRAVIKEIHQLWLKAEAKNRNPKGPEHFEENCKLVAKVFGLNQVEGEILRLKTIEWQGGHLGDILLDICRTKDRHSQIELVAQLINRPVKKVTRSKPTSPIDFETVSFAVPTWMGTRPYQQVPFQYSLHAVDESGGLRHFEFLELDGNDPRRALAQAMIEDCGSRGPIYVYNASFERRVIKELAESFTDLELPLLRLLDRIVDILPIARKCYYNPCQNGSWSLKAVAPAVSQTAATPHWRASKSAAMPVWPILKHVVRKLLRKGKKNYGSKCSNIVPVLQLSPVLSFVYLLGLVPSTALKMLECVDTIGCSPLPKKHGKLD